MDDDEDDPIPGAAYGNALGATPGAPYGPRAADLIDQLGSIKNPTLAQVSGPVITDPPDPVISALRAADALAARNNPADAPHLEAMLQLIESMDAERRAQNEAVAKVVEARRRAQQANDDAQSRGLQQAVRDRLKALQDLQKANDRQSGSQ